MRQYLFGAILAFPLAAAATSEPCERKEIRVLNAQSCMASRFSYYTDDKHNEGKLVRVSFGTNRNECKWPCDYIHEKVQYFLQTDSGDLVDLKEFPQEANDDRRAYGATVCLAKLLRGTTNDKNDFDSFYTYSGFPYDRISKSRYELKNQQIITHYNGNYPFEGEAKTTDGTTCTGDLRLKPEFVDLKQAAILCENAFAQEIKPDEPQYMKAAKLMMNRDQAGMYYVCDKTWQKPGSKWKIWHYRIALDRQNSKPIFLHLETP